MTDVRCPSLASSLIVLTLLFGVCILSYSTRISRATLDQAQGIEHERTLQSIALMSQDGDLIFRKGRSLISKAVLTADKRTKYSHVGIIVRIGMKPFVVHAEPSHRTNLSGTVGVEHLSTFTAFDKAAAVALFRVNTAAEVSRKKAATTALGYAKEALPFDNEFSLESIDALYCTELIWRAYLDAGVELVEGHFNELSVPLSSGPYLLPSSLQSSRHVQRIAVM